MAKEKALITCIEMINGILKSISFIRDNSDFVFRMTDNPDSSSQSFIRPKSIKIGRIWNKLDESFL